MSDAAPASQLTAVARPRSFEELVLHGIPDALSGRHGLNRHRTGVQQITADTDIEAIQVFLAEYDNRPATHRAYRKELQRFYYWVMAEAGKPMSSLRREDMERYRAFMAAPPAHWCGPRNARRATDHWRPFEGPLSERSRDYAMGVIENLFTYLCDSQYLAGNPLRASRKRSGPAEAAVDEPAEIEEPKFIALHTLERLLAALESECKSLHGLGDEHVDMERMLFVVRFLANTGLRRVELACAKLRHLHNVPDVVKGTNCWFLTVRGKGNKIAPVAVNDTALAALHRYQTVLGLDPYRAGPDMPLVVKLGVRERSAEEAAPLTDQTIYEIVVKALAIGAAILQADFPDDARRLTAATPHWFRHTFTTLMSNRGVPLPVIQQQLRHASIATTGIYSHAEQHQIYHAVNGLRL